MQITAWDFRLLHGILHWLSCAALDFLMPKITVLASGGALWILIAVLLLCFSRTRKNGIQLGVSCIGCGLIGNLLLKNLVARDRPCWLEEHLMLIAVPQDPDTRWFLLRRQQCSGTGTVRRALPPMCWQQ